MLLVMISFGFVMTKTGILSSKTRGDLTNIVLYFVLPCNIFGSFHKGITIEMFRQFGVVLVVSLGVHLLCMILMKVLYIHLKPEKRTAAQYATLNSNAAFIGLPVVEAVYGQTGLLFASIALIPLRIFMWTVGLALFTKTKTSEKVKTLVTHPCIWAVILGIAYVFAPFELPDFLSNAITTISGSTTALSMFVIGSLLTMVNPKEILDKDCFYFSFIRLIAIPAAVLGVLMLLRIDPLVIGVTVLLAGMPAAVATAMLSEKYGHDAKFASKIILISISLSVITLPVLSTVLTRIL